MVLGVYTGGVVRYVYIIYVHINFYTNFKTYLLPSGYVDLIDDVINRPNVHERYPPPVSLVEEE